LRGLRGFRESHPDDYDTTIDYNHGIKALPTEIKQNENSKSNLYYQS
jgi:hypothetical protein